MSHKSIYRTLFVQSRGALRKGLTAHLRTGRTVRRAKTAHTAAGRGVHSALLNISDRPAEADDRPVPGHWEGDLVFGCGMSPVVTAVSMGQRNISPS